MKRFRLPLFIFIILFPAGMLLSDCSRANQQKKNNIETENTVKEKEAEKEKQSVPVEKNKKEDEQKEQETNLKLTELKLPDIKTSYTTGTQKYLNLLPFYPESSIRPQDFHIGILPEEEISTVEVISAGKAITDFLDSVVKNEIDASLIAGGEDAELFRLMRYHIQKPGVITRYRIGIITIREDGTAYSMVRLSGENGGTNSEVYLSQTDDTWLVTDMQIDFYELASDNENNKVKFMPETYQSMYDGM